MNYLKRKVRDKGISIQERNQKMLEELASIGFVRDIRLTDAAGIPTREHIGIEFINDTIVFRSIPRGIKKICFIYSKDKMDLFSEGSPEILSLAYKNRHTFTLDNPKKNKRYCLKDLSDDFDLFEFCGTGKLNFYSSLSCPYHFEQIEASIIDIILLQGGNIRIDLINTAPESISFTASETLDDTIDICIDSEFKPGDIYISNVRNGLIINHPILAMALQNQAVLAPLDIGYGIYYAYTSFAWMPSETGNMYYDIDRVRGESAYQYNIELFE